MSRLIIIIFIIYNLILYMVDFHIPILNYFKKNIIINTITLLSAILSFFTSFFGFLFLAMPFIIPFRKDKYRLLFMNNLIFITVYGFLKSNPPLIAYIFLTTLLTTIISLALKLFKKITKFPIELLDKERKNIKIFKLEDKPKYHEIIAYRTIHLFFLIILLLYACFLFFRNTDIESTYSIILILLVMIIVFHRSNPLIFRKTKFKKEDAQFTLLFLTITTMIVLIGFSLFTVYMIFIYPTLSFLFILLFVLSTSLFIYYFIMILNKNLLDTLSLPSILAILSIIGLLTTTVIKDNLLKKPNLEDPNIYLISNSFDKYFEFNNSVIIGTIASNIIIRNKKNKKE